MKKFIVNLVCCFVPSKKLRHEIRVFSRSTRFKNNIIEIVRENGTRTRVRYIKNCEFIFSGDNNHIVLHEPINGMKLKVNVSSGVFIEIHGSKIWNRNISVLKELGETDTNRLIIGKNFTSTDRVHIDFCHGAGDVIIGDDCMFSWDIYIRTGDFHTIYDMQTKKLINPNKNVIIGNHVWLGAECRVLKGAIIPDNTVVGTRSVVTSQFHDANVVIAGTPAKVIKSGTGWDRIRPALYR